MRDFSHLPAPILLQPLPGNFQMITEGNSRNYFCPDCGKHLCWIDAIDEWTCLNCNQNSATKMQIKTISYHRVINLGNYESKRLELFAEVEEGEDPETAISSLAELVERKARESFELIFDIKELKRERRELSQEVDRLKAEKDKLSGVEADPDDIPFDQTPQAPKDDPSENF